MEKIYKKTQKLVTAVYMVTECLNDTEQLKDSLRKISLSLLHKMARVDSLTSVKTHQALLSVQVDTQELLALLEIGSTVGLVGSMNSSILMREFTLLSTEINQLLTENTKASFTLPMFKSQQLERIVISKDREQLFDENQISVGEVALRTYASLSKGQIQYKRQDNEFNKGQKEVEQILEDHEPKGQSLKDKVVGQSKKFELAIKNERRNSILQILKDKEYITVKDVSEIIKNCSEKTLQRELLSLVANGVLKKEGDKRWSRYALKG